jgi:hypothetical protein
MREPDMAETGETVKVRWNLVWIIYFSCFDTKLDSSTVEIVIEEALDTDCKKMGRMATSSHVFGNIYSECPSDLTPKELYKALV